MEEGRKKDRQKESSLSSAEELLGHYGTVKPPLDDSWVDVSNSSVSWSDDCNTATPRVEHDALSPLYLVRSCCNSTTSTADDDSVGSRRHQICLTHPACELVNITRHGSFASVSHVLASSRGACPGDVVRLRRVIPSETSKASTLHIWGFSKASWASSPSSSRQAL